MSPRRRRTPTPKEAVVLQREMAGRVVATDDFGDLEDLSRIAGVDVGVRGGRARAVVAVLERRSLETLEVARFERPLDFPYVPGLLAFREVPAILAALERLSAPPDLLLVDGHGLAHPRRIGVACHLGVVTGLPAVGCGKSRLVGEHREPGPRRGARTRLVHRGERIGTVLRTRTGVRPVYVSVGHRVSLATAERLVLAAAPRYRLPEPIRAADRLAGARP